MALVSGITSLLVNGVRYPTAGDFEFGLGGEKLESYMGADGARHTTSSYQVAFIDGKVILERGMPLSSIKKTRGATVILMSGHDRKLTLLNADFCGDGNINTQKSEFTVRFEGDSAELEDK